MQQVELVLCRVKGPVPQVYWKVLCCSTEDQDEVIFLRLDLFLCDVALVVVGGH